MIDRAFAAVLALPLAAYAAVGAFSRYTADDFCWAGVLRTEGFVNANAHWYLLYSPRYAFTFLVNVVELIGPAIVPALPASAIVVWVAILTWTFAQFNMKRLPALAVAEVCALATLQTAPDLPQSLYWQTGLLTYLLPLLLATFLIGWVRRGNNTWWAVLVSGAITFFAGGLSETYLIPQNVAITLALLVALVLKSRRAHLAAALAGGVLGLLVIVLAPATASRIQGTPADLWLALSAAIATGWYQLVHVLRYFPLTVLLSLFVPAIIGAGPCRVSRQWVLIVTGAVLVTLPFCYFPSFYAQNGNPPSRSLIVPGAVFVGYMVFLGFVARDVAARWLPQTRRALAVAACALIPLGVAVTTLPDVVNAAQYATVFDAEDRQIRASADTGQTDLTVQPLPPNYGEDFVGPDRQDWFNQCVARYYGVASIATPT
jgi:uncharacterized protein DUF6056